MLKRKKAPSKVERLARGLPTFDLVPWASNALFSVGRAITAFQKEPSTVALDAAIEGLETALALLREARSRHRLEPIPPSVDPHLQKLLDKYQAQRPS